MDPMDSPDPVVQLDHRDNQAHRVTLAEQVLLVNRGPSDHKVLLGHQDKLANPVSLVSRELKELPEQQDSQEHRDHRDNQDSGALLDYPAA